VIISDNGKNYTSKIFKKFIEKNKIKHTLIPPYTPSSNGVSERINQTFSEMIRMYKSKGIKKILSKVRQRLNRNYHTTIKAIPEVIVHKTNVFNPGICDEAYAAVKKNIQDYKKFNRYKIGDLVYVKRFLAEKIDSQYEGPFKVVEVSRKGLWIRVKEREPWYHIKNVKA
jgi:hypothetical protein